MVTKKSKPKKVEEIEEPKVEEEVEAVEVKPEEVKPVEVEEVKFKNNTGNGIKIKLVDGRNINWMTVKPGDIVTIPEKIALANNLTKVE